MTVEDFQRLMLDPRLSEAQRAYLGHALAVELDYAQTRIRPHRESHEVRWQRYCRSKEAEEAAYRALTDGEREGLAVMAGEVA